MRPPNSSPRMTPSPSASSSAKACGRSERAIASGSRASCSWWGCAGLSPRGRHSARGVGQVGREARTVSAVTPGATTGMGMWNGSKSCARGTGMGTSMAASGLAAGGCTSCSGLDLGSSRGCASPGQEQGQVSCGWLAALSSGRGRGSEGRHGTVADVGVLELLEGKLGPGRDCGREEQRDQRAPQAGCGRGHEVLTPFRGGRGGWGRSPRRCLPLWGVWGAAGVRWGGGRYTRDHGRS